MREAPIDRGEFVPTGVAEFDRGTERGANAPAGRQTAGFLERLPGWRRPIAEFQPGEGEAVEFVFRQGKRDGLLRRAKSEAQAGNRSLPNMVAIDDGGAALIVAQSLARPDEIVGAQAGVRQRNDRPDENAQTPTDRACPGREFETNDAFDEAILIKQERSAGRQVERAEDAFAIAPDDAKQCEFGLRQQLRRFRLFAALGRLLADQSVNRPHAGERGRVDRELHRESARFGE